MQRNASSPKSDNERKIRAGKKMKNKIGISRQKIFADLQYIVRHGNMTVILPILNDDHPHS